uniref:Ig-like domain-containing protein n=1 Tax=Maylandia zebra TaxID=106582 RepID=A0A3P9DH46_9CICH
MTENLHRQIYLSTTKQVYSKLIRVKGQPGQDVTLPCKYDRKYHRSMNVCWQRGEIPARGCSNPLISTDGLRVLTRASSRYELLGRLEDGDVSLTIKSLTEGDAGRYGCRVRIPGWFNDDKHHFDLSEEAVNVKTTSHIQLTFLLLQLSETLLQATLPSPWQPPLAPLSDLQDASHNGRVVALWSCRHHKPVHVPVKSLSLVSVGITGTAYV